MSQGSPDVTPTWRPPEKSEQITGKLDAAETNELPDSSFAFPAARKEALVSASHVRNALARFDQVEDVSDADRALAFANIRSAAAYFDVNVSEQSWTDLMRNRSHP